MYVYVVHSRLRGVRSGRILSPQLFSILTESGIREAEIKEQGRN